jgi:hypothetical protein
MPWRRSLANGGSRLEPGRAARRDRPLRRGTKRGAHRGRLCHRECRGHHGRIGLGETIGGQLGRHGSRSGVIGQGVGCRSRSCGRGDRCRLSDAGHRSGQIPLSDERLEGIGRREVWRRVLIRFPLGTALFEEVVFRGVLPAAFRHRPTWQREAISASAFAAWHIIPTWHTLDANTGGRSWGRGRKAAAVVGGSVAAGVAGLTLSALKRSSSSLTAPWLAHTTVSALTLLVAARLGEPAGRSQSSS